MIGRLQLKVRVSIQLIKYATTGLLTPTPKLSNTSKLQHFASTTPAPRYNAFVSFESSQVNPLPYSRDTMIGAYATEHPGAPKVYEKYINSPLDEPIASDIDHEDFD
jgi:hypothetical protein